MRQTNKLKKIAIMAVNITVALFTVSCSNDDFFGLDDKYDDYDNRIDSFIQDGYDVFISLDSYDFKDWTIADYMKISEAEDRMEIIFNSGLYTIGAKSAKKINIADSLFDMIKGDYEYTNSLLNKNKQRIMRSIKSNPEDGCLYPNCVPIALTHLKYNAPTYQQAEAECDAVDSTWRSHNGVYSMYVEGLINQHISVYKLTPSTINFTEYTDLDQCVLLINEGGHQDHAVNASYYDPSCGLFNTPRIRYYDFKREHSGRIRISEMTALYPYNSND